MLLAGCGNSVGLQESSLKNSATAPQAVSGGPLLDPAPPANPAGHFYDWTGTPSDIAGGIAFTPGEIIVSDHPFDDHGGDTNTHDADPSDVVPGSGQGANAACGNAPQCANGGANGDYKYPAEAVYARNAADIVETRLAADADAWYVLVRLNTLNDAERSAVELRIDGHVLVAHGQQGTLDGKAVDVVGDTAQALFEIRVPRTVYNPGDAVQQVFVAAGLWDTVANTWRTPSAGLPAYFDLAYVPVEGMDSYWRDAKQSADIVAGTFDADRFSVDFGALRRNECPSNSPCPGHEGPSAGLISRVFRSGQPLGRGVILQARYGQGTGYSPPNVYLSPYQPYAIYVPKHQTGALVLLLHFLGGNYMSYPLTSMPQLADWAEKLGVIVAMPLARGEGGWYEGEAEKDVFEVWQDVAAHYNVDPERVYLTGMSMGGFGTWRLGQLYPDLFARGMIWAGPVVPNTFWVYPAAPIPPSCAPGESSCGYNLVDLFGNTRNLPLFVVHGGLDELVTSTGAEHWMADYATMGNATYRYLFYPDRRHETSYPGTTESWVLQWLQDLPPRVINPVHVTYKLMRSFFQPKFGIGYDGAYWAKGLALVDGADTGVIDASRTTDPDLTKVLADQYGVDSLGPYRLRGSDVTPAAAIPNAVFVHLSNLSRAVLDTRQMGWSLVAPVHVSGDTDRPMDLVLKGDFPAQVAVQGAASTEEGSALTLHLQPGRFDVTVQSTSGAR